MSGANLDHVVGRTLGERYQLVSRIGSGASADVYQANDLRLGRHVAVKQLRSDLTEDSRFRKLFRTEAKLAAQLSHPNILTVFDWDDDADGLDGGAYIVTELLSGGTLRHVLNSQRTLSQSQVAFIGLQAAQGLAAAHDQGLVHRDVKPANLMFGQDGRIHIGDFGIARAVAEAAWTEPEGVLIGTARYAAPEQATAGPINGLADVYSLTVCLIESLTGNVPLVRENALGTMILRQAEDLPVDDSFGELAEPLAWAGLADASQRATAAELLDLLLGVCRSLPDPEPLTLIDLTENGESDHVAVTGGPGDPNVRFNTGGELVIESDDSYLALPADEHSDQDRVNHADVEENGALNDRTSDEYLTTGHPVARSRRGWWLALGLLFVALAAGAVVAGRIVAETRQEQLAPVELGIPSAPVGDYGPMTVAEVEESVVGTGWTIEVIEQYEDGTNPGQILGQNPAPGIYLMPGSRVELVVSLGPELRTVPELVGRTTRQAEDAIGQVFLTVGEVTEKFDEEVAAGVVMEATIDGVAAQPGSQFLTGTTIDLVVSLGPSPRTVPQVTGLTVEQARISVEAAGLVLAVTEAFSDTVPAGQIISMNPGAESTVVRGSTVTVTVSQGLPFVTVPDVAGRPVPEAIDALKAEGFEVVINGAVGTEVLTTRPVAGESVRKGTQIEIVSSE